MRRQALLLRRRRTKSNQTYHVESSTAQINENQYKLDPMYPIGSCLVQLMLERQLISIWNNDSNQLELRKRRNGSYFIQSHLYAVCNFDISLLPIKFNLPMVCKPLDWGSVKHPRDNIPKSLSDLSGGYLSSITGDIYI